MEPLSFYLQETSVSDALSVLVAYCYDVWDGKKHRDDIDQLNEAMLQSKSALMKQLLHECAHKNAAEKTDYISHVWSTLVFLKDTAFNRMQLRARAGKEEGKLLALYSGLQKIENRILKSWPAYCCKKTVKVDDRSMSCMRHDIHKKCRELKKRLNWHVADTELIELALQPLLLLVQGRNRSVLVFELEQVQQYIAALEKVLPRIPVNGISVITGARKYVDTPLLKILANSGFLAAGQLPQLNEDNVEMEIPVDAVTKKRFRLTLSNTLGFFAALLRTFKENDYVLNFNMAEVRRFFYPVIQISTTDAATEGSMEDAYKNISEPTRKSLIAFLKQCIRWLEAHKC